MLQFSPANATSAITQAATLRLERVLDAGKFTTQLNAAVAEDYPASDQKAELTKLLAASINRKEARKILAERNAHMFDIAKDGTLSFDALTFNYHEHYLIKKSPDDDDIDKEKIIGALYGSCGEKSFHIGAYWLMPNARGNNVIPVALAIVCHQVFKNGYKPKITLKIHENNHASERAVTKVGGTLDAEQTDELYRRWHILTDNFYNAMQTLAAEQLPHDALPKQHTLQNVAAAIMAEYNQQQRTAA